MISAFKCSHGVRIWRRGKLVGDAFSIGAVRNGMTVLASHCKQRIQVKQQYLELEEGLYLSRVRYHVKHFVDYNLNDRCLGKSMIWQCWGHKCSLCDTFHL